MGRGGRWDKPLRTHRPRPVQEASCFLVSLMFPCSSLFEGFWLMSAPVANCCVTVSLLQVMSKLKSEATGLKGSLVSALLSASTTYIQARRVVTGHSLLHAAAPPSAGQRLVAAVSMALTAPLYALAQKLVFGKVCVCVGGVGGRLGGVGGLKTGVEMCVAVSRSHTSC